MVLSRNRWIGSGDSCSAWHNCFNTPKEQGIEEMNKILLTATAALVIALIALSFGLVYQQIEIQNIKSSLSSPSPQPTATESPSFSPPSTSTNSILPTQISTPTLSPTSTPSLIPSQIVLHLPETGVNAILNITSALSGGYLLLSGTVTNNSTNTQYNVGLKVFADGYPIVGNPNKLTLINLTIPIDSGTYMQTSDGTASLNGGVSTSLFPQSTLNPNQSVAIEIMIYPLYQSQTPTLYDFTVDLI
jgi:hypothetical protein